MTKLIDLLPNINLIDENGNSSKFYDLVKNKTVVLNMFYSNCKIKCVPLGKLLKKVNVLLKNYINAQDIVFISITLDAKNDTISDLNSFKNQVWDDECSNWHFYTGNYKDIERFRYKIGMYNPEIEIDKIKSNHTGHFLLFNEKTGFVKHTEAFDNPLDISRKILQIVPQNFYCHTYDLSNLNFEALTDNELFENIHSINAMFTVPFLPEYIRSKYVKHAELQRGFQYKPPIQTKGDKDDKKSCCCKCKK
jgi:cytochrome oxidase Cu insertion factor (SCO1/SenC/PrrC family)